MTDPGRVDERTDNRFHDLCEQVVTEMERLAIPGAVVGVCHEGQVWTAGFGVTSVEHPLPVTPDTLFQVGSITKTFLATAVMRLVEMGRLALDEPVRTYLPDLKLKDEGVAARVTMRHLLTHTGGWVGDYFDDFGLGDDALAMMVAKMADLEQLTPLGEVYSYNNAGFYLAGRVIEVLTGTSFEAAMRELVLDPLGLERSFFFAHEVITHRFAVGHQVVDKQAQVARPWAIGRAVHPAGGIVCTVEDLLRYARFHMGDGTISDGRRLLSEESLARMQTPLFPSTGLNEIGLTWVITTVDGTKMIAHGGGTKGQVTHLRIVPSHRFAVTVFTNSEEGGTLCDPLVLSATKRYLGLSLPEAAPLDLPEEELLAYAGTYDSVGAVFELYLQGGRLMLQQTPKGGFPTPDSPPGEAPPPIRVAVYAPDRIIVLDEPMKDARGEFLRNADGSITWLRLGGRIRARQA